MKSLVASLVVAILMPTFAEAYVTTCSGKLPNGEEVMFELLSFEDQKLEFAVGKPFAFRPADVYVKKVKVSGGFFEKVISLRDGTRFDLRFRKTIGNVDDFRVTANMPEISFVVKDLPLDCLSYY